MCEEILLPKKEWLSSVFSEISGMVQVATLSISVLAISCLNQSIWGLKRIEVNTPYNADSLHDGVLWPSVWSKK